MLFNSPSAGKEHESASSLVEARSGREASFLSPNLFDEIWAPVRHVLYRRYSKNTAPLIRYVADCPWDSSKYCRDLREDTRSGLKLGLSLDSMFSVQIYEIFHGFCTCRITGGICEKFTSNLAWFRYNLSRKGPHNLFFSNIKNHHRHHHNGCKFDPF